MDSAHAPVITSAIRVADELDGGEGRGFYLEDAGQPEFVSWMLQLLDAPRSVFELIPKLPKLAGNFLTHKDTDIGARDRRASSATAPSRRASCRCWAWAATSPRAIMRCEDGGLQIDWKKNGASKEYFERVRDVSKAVAEEIGGDVPRQPDLAAEPRRHRARARRRADGPRRRARASSTRTAASSTTPACTSPTDRSCPGPVGPNPSLTIAGLADRFADAILEEMKGNTVTAPPPPAAARADAGPPAERAPRRPSSSPRRCAASSRSARTTTTRAFARARSPRRSACST